MVSKVRKHFELKTARLPGGDRKLLGPLRVHRLASRLPELQVWSGSVCSGAVDVYSGFVTDFSSIPTPLHWVVGWSQVDVAGVVHDFLYRDTSCPRAIADDVWWELARSGLSSVGQCRAWLCWMILRGCGWYCRRTQPEFRFWWSILAGVVLAVVGLLMLPILTVTALLWLIDRLSGSRAAAA